MRIRHVLPEPGDTFAGRFLVEGQLGRGGMAVVLAARQIDTGRAVALKILYPHVLTSSAAREGFENEARLAARIGGPHLVAVLEAGVDEERELPFLAMERLDGETLGALVARRGALPPGEALVILGEIAAALGRAHAHVDDQGKPSPVVHRDLKPDNVFLARAAEGSTRVRVLDFGIAKVLREATTVTREVKGTPLYMSYEQAARSRVTPQTDLWAYGLVAFFLMTGRSYWRSSVDSDGSTIGLFAEVLSLPLATASERAREYGLEPPWPAAFDAWFARCVCRQPRDRFTSATEAADALADALGSTAAVSPLAGRAPASRALLAGALLLGAATLALVGVRAHASAAAVPPGVPATSTSIQATPEPPDTATASVLPLPRPATSTEPRATERTGRPAASTTAPVRRAPEASASKVSSPAPTAPSVNPYADR